MQLKTLLYTSLQLLASANLANAEGNTLPCVNYHLVCARGSDEPPGEGIIGGVAALVVDRVPSSNSIGLNYPSTFAKYRFSETDGVTNLTQHIEDYTQRCPDSMIGLLGYSQGAQVIGDTLYGNTEHSGFNHSEPLELKYGKNIAAIVLMGDPTFRPGLPWDAGTSTKHGVFHRSNISYAWPYANVTRSYCDHGDVYCASGNSATAHGLYVQKYAQVAADFMIRSHRRSQRPGGGVDVSLAPGHRNAHHKTHHNPQTGKHNRHRGSKGRRSGSPHNSDQPPGNGHNKSNGVSTLWQSTSKLAWLLVPITMIML